MKLYPRCINLSQQPTLSATGYIVPCCWADSPAFEGMESLVQPHLHINNVNDVEDIISSKEWDTFFDDLINNPDNAPPVCKQHCCTNKSLKNRTTDETNY